MTVPDPQYYERFQNLIDGLVKKTQDAIDKGEPMWEQIGPDVYELSLTRSSIRLRSRDRDGTYPFIFELFDEWGTVVETLEDNPVDGTVKLDKLYNTVTSGKKQKVVKEAISEILGELDIPEYEPPPF